MGIHEAKSNGGTSTPAPSYGGKPLFRKSRGKEGNRFRIRRSATTSTSGSRGENDRRGEANLFQSGSGLGTGDKLKAASQPVSERASRKVERDARRQSTASQSVRATDRKKCRNAATTAKDDVEDLAGWLAG